MHKNTKNGDRHAPEPWRVFVKIMYESWHGCLLAITYISWGRSNIRRWLQASWCWLACIYIYIPVCIKTETEAERVEEWGMQVPPHHTSYSMYVQGTETETEAEAERERQRHAPRPYRTSETNRMYVYIYYIFSCILYICHMLYGHAKGGDQRSWTVWKSTNVALTRGRERERDSIRERQRVRHASPIPPHQVHKYICMCISTTWGQADSEHLETLQI